MNADFEVAPVCLDTPTELPDLADRIEHTAPADIVVSPPVPVDWQAVAAEYRDLAAQTAAQLAQARMEVAQFRQRLIAAGLLDGP